ncbi:unnamed protein product [Fusarium fujikuroi]|nr:unnamed protein product [Fusarium fujikuroi]
MPLSTPGLIPKVAEGPEYMTLMAASGWFEVGRRLTGRGYTSKANATIITKPPMCSSKVSPETRAHINGVFKRDKMYQGAETQPRFYSKVLGDDSFAATSLWLERTR